MDFLGCVKLYQERPGHSVSMFPAPGHAAPSLEGYESDRPLTRCTVSLTASLMDVHQRSGQARRERWRDLQAYRRLIYLRYEC